MRVHTKGDPGSGEKLGQEGSKELGKEGSVCEKGPGHGGLEDEKRL